ncbi:hypothetical protein HN873_072337 [Arachis hypogaea]
MSGSTLCSRITFKIKNENEYIQSGYKVKEESMPILKKILAKYGDIAKDCTLTGKMSCSMYLGMIIDIIRELQDKDLGRIDQDYLQDMIGLVKEFKNIRLELVGFFRDSKMFSKRAGL